MVDYTKKALTKEERRRQHDHEKIMEAHYEEDRKMWVALEH